MVVQHNMPAMTANRYYTANNSSLSKSLEKLSSGYAINRAGDNAAGLAVSEKMRAQIAGLTQASKNAEDGISMVQTYEGALQETDSILQRMRTIAVQSANGSYQNDVDRDALQLEFDQLNDELNQIADTDFNGVVALNGGIMADGTVVNNTDKVADKPDVEQVSATPNSTFSYGDSLNGTVDTSGNGAFTVNGVRVQLTSGRGSATLGSAANGGQTTYSTNNISVSSRGGQPYVNGTVSATETYAIDDQTSSISIHGQSYTIGSNGLSDSDGNNVGFIDGLQVNVTSGESVTLTGSFSIVDNVVSERDSFNYSTTGGLSASGALDSSNNGVVLVNGTQINVTGGNFDDTTSAGGVATYTQVDAFVVDDNAVRNGETYTAITGDFKVTGTVAAEEKTTNSALEAEVTKVGSGSDADIYRVSVNGQNLYTSDGSTFYTLKSGKEESALSGSNAVADIFTLNCDAVSNLTQAVNGTTDDNALAAKYSDVASNGDFATTSDKMTFTTKQYQATLDDGTVVSLNKGQNAIIDTTGGTIDSSTDAGGTTTVYGVKTNDGLSYYNNAGTLTIGTHTAGAGTADMEIKFTQAADVGDNIGTFKVSNGVSTSNAFNHGTANLTFTDNMTLQVGARTKDAVRFNFSYTTNGIGNLKSDLNASARGLGTDQVKVSTQEDANAAIDAIDNAINKVSMIRGTFGAIQNRLEHKISNINTNAENLTAAESRIRDTQMDQEMMKFTSAQILSQASQSMLAQANSLPQGVLQLLG